MFVYIAADKRKNVLYVGVTNDIERRSAEHKFTESESFAHRYKTNKIVYVEECQSALDAIARKTAETLDSRKKVRPYKKSESGLYGLYGNLN